MSSPSVEIERRRLSGFALWVARLPPHCSRDEVATLLAEHLYNPRYPRQGVARTNEQNFPRTSFELTYRREVDRRRDETVQWA